ncbi:MAG: T9SS type A sorting domain-containing protein, partial [Melioribacteraceae bacterium]|nr:T9SS type A sorting domain-containing protein [Melioribacteraceae bacterium]
KVQLFRTCISHKKLDFSIAPRFKFNIPVAADHASPAGRHQSARTILRIYNALGEQVTELLNQEFESVFHSVDFDASNLTSGLYFYRICVALFKIWKIIQLGNRNLI